MDGDQRLRSADDECAHRAGQCIHGIGEQFQGLLIDGGRRLPLGDRIACCLLDRGGRKALPGVSYDTAAGI
jgi:hypothetical protein